LIHSLSPLHELVSHKKTAKTYIKNAKKRHFHQLPWIRIISINRGEAGDKREASQKEELRVN
jgi:hypothetical protein